ncbi:lysyl-tRNA synthetase [Xylariomycetidae sp. FL0641]|nr:lysyl-tRNA synthetase [Xylariomycetidae sp. FL0641]
MADNSNQAAAAPEAAQQQKLHKDPVTGEMISKTELKKREKQRKNAEEKAKKAQANPQPKPKASSAKPEEELNPNQYFEIRSRQIDALRSSKQPNPYPHKFHVNTRIGDFHKKYEDIQSGESRKDVDVRVGVRVMAIRSYGVSLRFYDCKAEGVSIQVMCEANEATGVPFAEQHDLLRRGDWIGVNGYPGRTKPKSRDVGELSVMAREVVLLTPCLHQLPSSHFGLKDKEQRYRQRYLDLIMNDNTRNTFITRSKIISFIRSFLNEREFLEVQTPMMNKIAGGAAARPFKTFHNDLQMELFMRVAPELYLKQLVVGGLERVYEIGRQFRNEDIDLTHNPEFTTMEFYCAFFDVHDLMDLTEEMVSSLVKAVTGSYKTTFHAQDGTEYSINWEKPWPRYEMIPELEKATGTKFPPADQLHTDESAEFLKSLLEKLNIQCSPPQTASRMIDKLVGEFIESKCINPSFIKGHPMIMSPLAKADRDIPGLCERFEVFVCTKEIANAYTELNDPFDQRERFEEQAKDKAAGDLEAQAIDETFCQALEYGLPPTGGFGMGIDRVVMFLTNQYSIKEVLTFPLMKDVQDAGPKEPMAMVGALPGSDTVPLR